MKKAIIVKYNNLVIDFNTRKSRIYKKGSEEKKEDEKNKKKLKVKNRN